ncbi:GNAT family N-acetyltransferase [Caulobacter sp. CCUG 60055]|uniref:GNAT family N-acetyltransferase n=1 Tax=Caulobacter sp. CCUG 60055 TaxID=2100090 RepID=UPI001FA715CE|nr:GNAT family N-acetyltransferase [Caulobacter sp. CCUG 60055]MBQ1542133.1 GNAT family N-acetyltransferase [Caulobacteraceae bacterium]
MSSKPGAAVPMALETERLLLRAWTDADRAPFAAINADPEVRRYYYPSVLDAAETDALIDEAIAQHARDGFGFMAVRRKADGVLIGGAGLSVAGDEAPGEDRIELGWILGRAFWRQGYAAEISAACLDFAWSVLRLGRVIGYTSKINLPSQRAMEKIGMRPTVAFEDVTVPPGDPLRPHLLYAIDNPGRAGAP